MARNTSDPFTGNTYLRAFLYAYNLALGDFNTDDFDEEDKHLLNTMWFVNTMVIPIIFLNLLIAIMGDTFDRVQETSESNTLKETASIMVENEFLINRERLFGEVKYIIVIEEDKAEQSETSWDGKLQKLKDYIYGSVSKQNKILNELQMYVSKTFREKTERRIKDLESSTNRYFTNVTAKIEQVEMMLESILKQCKCFFKAY